MKVNCKKPLTIKNNSKYFNPSKDRSFIEVLSPDTYKSRKAKIEGYEARLYWQFKECLALGGQTFFYTLTYNDFNVPKHYGVNCFDYEHLRDLLTGGFRKMLLRKYGTVFKYFVGAELGDGAGSRGLHNNPHYHILFFLIPDTSGKFEYKVISPLEFRALVRKYWQGYDQDKGYVPYSHFKYGIAKEGENVGLVTDYRACIYCAKYVCKDVKLKVKEINVRKLLLMKFRSDLKKSLEFHQDYVLQVLLPLYGIPTDSWCNYDKSIPELLASLQPELLEFFKKIPHIHPLEMFDFENDVLIYTVKQINSKNDLWRYYYDFLNERLTFLVDNAISEWRNRFSNKCRISHGVGDYALQFIRDYTNPSIEVPTKNGFVARPLCLYYYRKLFTGIVRPLEKCYNGKYISHDAIRVLNRYGVEFKVAQLKERLDKLSVEAAANFSLIQYNRELFEDMRNSDINTEVHMSYLECIRKFEEFSDVDIFRKYAEYKAVYEGRYMKVVDNMKFPEIDVENDFRRFLIPSVFDFYRTDMFVDELYKQDFKGFLSYEDHPYFIHYVGFFHVLDLVKDYFFVQEDNVKQKDAEKYAEIRRFHKKREFFSYLQTI